MLRQAACGDLAGLGALGRLSLAMLAAIAVGIAAGASDIASRRIPNRLTYAAILGGLALGGACGGESFIQALGGLAVAGLPFLAGYLCGGVGGGDVKLMAGLGALVGWPAALHLVIASLCAAGLGIALAAIWSGRLERLAGRALVALALLRAGEPRSSLATLRGPDAVRRTIPFGPAAALGTLIAVAQPLLPSWLVPWA